MTDVYGDLISPDDVAVAVEEHIRTWLRAYLDKVAIGRGFSRRIPSPMYRRTNSRPERWPEDKLATLIIVAEDVTDIVRDGDGTITLTFPVGLALVATASSAQGQDFSNRLAKAMGAALALLLLQKDTITVGDVDAVTEWIPYRFGEMQPENDRRFAAVSQGVQVHVPVMNEFGGPQTPTPDDSPDPIPPGDYVDVERVEIDDEPLD